MKRIFICLLLFCSCVNELYLPFEPSADGLILNARFEIQNKSHSIFLSYKKGGIVTIPNNPIVLLSINNLEYQKLTITENNNNYIEYRFNYDFKQGDNIKILATNDKKEASAEVSFPVVTTPLKLSGDDKQLDMSFTDNPSTKDYYRVIVYGTGTVRELRASEVIREEKFTSTINFSSDNPLIDNNIKEGDNIFQNFSSLFTPTNKMRVFSDETVSGKEIKLDIKVLNEVADYHNDYSNIVKIENRKLVVALQHLSSKDYHYFCSLNSGANFGYAGNILIEPTIVPSNVKGGTGYVMALSSSISSIDREDIIIDHKYY